MPADISQLLAFGVKNKASDLHLSAGVPPMIRVDGDVRRINMPPLEHKDVHDMVYDIMNDKQRKDYAEFLERSEEHTSELQSPVHSVCRLLLEKKKNKYKKNGMTYKKSNCRKYQSPELPT